MEKKMKSQADDEFERLLQKFIDEELDTPDETDDSTQMDDNETDDLPFPKEMSDRAADAMIRNHHSTTKCMEDVSSVSLDLMTDHEYYSDASMKVTFKGKPGASLRPHRFTCSFFTDDYMPICEGKEVAKIKNGRSRELTMEIP